MRIHHLFFFPKQTRRPKKWRGSRAGPCHACLCASEMWGSLRGFVRHELWGLCRVSVGSEGAGALHRLNRLGATAACSSRMRECILGRQWHVFESWRVSGGGPVSARLCAAFVELSRCRWRELFFLHSGFFFFGTCTRKHTSLADTFLWGSHAFWCNYTLDEWAQAGTSLSLWMCVLFLCLCVAKVRYCFLHTVGGLLAVDLLFTFWGRSLSSKPQAPLVELES